MYLNEHTRKDLFVNGQFFNCDRIAVQVALAMKHQLQLVPGNFSSGRGVVPSLAGLGEQSCQRGYFQFGM
jgi:hypothetical protein